MTTSVTEQILNNAQDSRQVVQDFVPLAESLESELGQQYLKDRGNKRSSPTRRQGHSSS